VVARTTQTAPGGSRLLTSDARVRIGAGPGDSFTTAVGAGWAWGQSTPFVSWTLGTRGGQSLRWGLDAEVRSYFAPWRRQTVSYSEGEVVEVLEDEHFRRAGIGVTVGVVLELPRWRE